MQQAHYFRSPVLVFDGPELKFALHQALVSRQGIFNISEATSEMNRAFLESRVFRVAIDNLEYRARLVRESGPEGIRYNLRLLDPDQEQNRRLLGLLQRFGIENPWKRDFPRIPASPLFMQVEVPIGAVLSRFSGPTSAEVRNFSYFGLQLEFKCGYPSMGEAVGQHLRFQLVTSQGKVLDWATGRIARIFDEMIAPKRVCRGLGIRLLDMSNHSSQQYDGMILAACREIQRGLRPGSDAGV